MAKKKTPVSPQNLLSILDYNEPEQKVKGYRRRYTQYDPSQDKDETPAVATEMLLSVEQFSGTIFEPMAGKGGIVNVLRHRGYNVSASDIKGKDELDEGIVPNIDFLSTTEMWDNIISAPPMKIAGAMAYHAIQHVKHKVAFFSRATLLENVSRRELLFDNPAIPTCFEKLYVFSDRMPIGEANMIMYGWFIWRKDFRGTPTIHWL